MTCPYNGTVFSHKKEWNTGFVRETDKCAKDMNNLPKEKDKMTNKHKEHAQPSWLLKKLR